jgi:ribulose-phosphate 3-epimerase
MKKIAPSILSADFSKLETEIQEIESAGADMLHCDIMDGHFVPNISFGQNIVKIVNVITELPLDVHLMIDNSEKYLEEFRKAGADYISVHFENNTHLHRIISKIKELGAYAGVVINPATPVSFLSDILHISDFILIMSVNPGFGGQKFIEDSINKIKELKSIIIDNNYNCLIEIDGGINLDNINRVSDAGADIIVAGASIFNTEDRIATLKKMKTLI